MTGSRRNAKQDHGCLRCQKEKFKLQHNETILSLQSCKLIREDKGSTEEWMGCIRVKVNECEYKEKDKIERIIYK